MEKKPKIRTPPSARNLISFPRIGVGVCVIKDGKVLFGKRKNAHGEGSWCFPGGHLEWNESIEECAKREVLEETWLSIKDLRFGPYTNDIFEKENKHYVTLFVIADYDSGELKLMEPEKCERWNWFDWKKLPRPLFLPVQNLLKGKYNPFQN
jgi:8-oxo-dGTP diphosphatase